MALSYIIVYSKRYNMFLHWFLYVTMAVFALSSTLHLTGSIRSWILCRRHPGEVLSTPQPCHACASINDLNRALGYSILYYTILYYTILYYTIPYHTIPYHTIPYHTIPYYTILYYTILYYTVVYHSYSTGPQNSISSYLGPYITCSTIRACDSKKLTERVGGIKRRDRC